MYPRLLWYKGICDVYNCITTQLPCGNIPRWSYPRSKVTITIRDREQNETKYPASSFSYCFPKSASPLLSEPEKKDTADISANSERIKIWDFFKAWNKCIVSFYPMRLIEFESHNGKRKAEILLKKVIFLLICFAQTLSSIFSLVFSDIHQEESHMERYMSLHMLMYWNPRRASWCPIHSVVSFQICL